MSRTDGGGQVGVRMWRWVRKWCGWGERGAVPEAVPQPEVKQLPQIADDPALRPMEQPVATPSEPIEQPAAAPLGLIDQSAVPHTPVDRVSDIIENQVGVEENPPTVEENAPTVDKVISPDSERINRNRSPRKSHPKQRGRTCTICHHPQVQAINKAIVAGVPYRDIARRYATKKDAVARHKRHIAAAIAQNASVKALETVAVVRAHEAQEVAHADSLLAQVAGMKREAEAILQDARRSPGSQARRDALLAIDKTLKALELIGRIEGELRDGVHVTVFESPEWMGLQARIVAALGPFPRAREAVLAALRGEPVPLSAPPVGPVGASEATVEVDRGENDNLRTVREVRRVPGTH